MGIFKCADYKVDCSLRNQTVEANPDIAGIGVSTNSWICQFSKCYSEFTILFAFHAVVDCFD